MSMYSKWVILLLRKLTVFESVSMYGNYAKVCKYDVVTAQIIEKFRSPRSMFISMSLTISMSVSVTMPLTVSMSRVRTRHCFRLCDHVHQRI